MSEFKLNQLVAVLGFRYLRRLVSLDPLKTQSTGPDAKAPAKHKIQHISHPIQTPKFSIGEEVKVEDMWEPGTIALIEKHCEKYRVQFGDHLHDSLFPENLISQIGSTKMRKRKKQNTTKRWQFEARHEEHIDFQQINEDCTKENPLLLVEWNGRKWVLLHYSILEQARQKGIKLPFTVTRSEMDDIEEVFKPVEKTPFPAVIAWTRLVRRAPWPVAKKNATVTVKVVNLDLEEE